MRARDTRALLVLIVGVAALVAVTTLWPHTARADWRSLTGPLPKYVNNLDFQISPDSKTVAFIADIDTDDVNELYAVPITGTQPIKLNPPLVAGGGVNEFQFTADGKRIVYRADQDVDNQIELYIVPVTGGTPLKLNGPLVAGGSVRSYLIDDADGLVIYLADEQVNEQFQLWSVPLIGGTPVNLSQVTVPGRQAEDIFKLEPLSKRLVFTKNEGTDEHLFDLYSVPVTGGTPVKLNPPIVNAGGGDSGIYDEFDLVLGQSKVVFTAHEAETGVPGSPQSPRGTLYSIPIDGSAPPTPLSFHMNPDQRIYNFRVSPVGTDVIFDVAQSILTLQQINAFEGSLYHNFVDAGGAANVTQTADPLFGTNFYRFLPDGSQVVYFFQNSQSTSIRLEAATMLGIRTTLYDPGPTGPKLYNFDVSPDSKWVEYQTAAEPSGLPDRLFLLPPTGGMAEDFGKAIYKGFLPDNSRILYTREVTGTFTDLFSQQVGTGGERNLSRLDPPGFVGVTQISPDSHWIVYQVQVNGQEELRVSDGTQAQPPTPTTTATSTATATTAPSAATNTPTATATLRPGETSTRFEERLPLLNNEK